MGLSSKKRRTKIYELVKVIKKVSVKELSEKYGVSLVTIRNDLEVLEREGYLFRTHGYANALDRRDQNLKIEELTIQEKQNVNRHIKVQLAVYAVKFINEGETIFLDSGSTTLEIARQIAKRRWRKLTVITNSVPVCMELSTVDNVDIRGIGGRMRKKSKSFVGPQSELALRDYRYTKLFLSADGYDIKQGITTHNEEEASLNRKMCEIASEIYIVTDYTKFGRQSSNWIRDFADIACVITDSGISDEYKQCFEKKGVRLEIIDN